MNLFQNNNPIGIFDSGVGGLSVAFGIQKMLPNEKIIYVADTKRQPYGEKSKEEVISYAKQISDYLAQMQVKAIIIACSTATAVALTHLKQRHPKLPIIGLINDTFIDQTIKKTSKIGIIATTLTTKSQTFSKALLKKAPYLEITNKACPKLVDLISEGNIDSDIFLAQIKKDIQPLLNKQIDTLILGCTHFALIENIFKQLFPKLKIISPPQLTTKHLKKQLKNYNLQQTLAGIKKDDLFLVTDNNEKFSKIVKKITTKTILFKELNLNETTLPLTA